MGDVIDMAAWKLRRQMMLEAARAIVAEAPQFVDFGLSFEDFIESMKVQRSGEIAKSMIAECDRLLEGRR